MPEPQSIQIKDVILNIIKIKKQRDSLKREIGLIEAQLEQQTKFMEDSVLEELIYAASEKENKKTSS